MKLLRHILKHDLSAPLFLLFLCFLFLRTTEAKASPIAAVVICLVWVVGYLWLARIDMREREALAQQHEQDLISFAAHILKHRSKMNIAPLTKTDVERWRKFNEA